MSYLVRTIALALLLAVPAAAQNTGPPSLGYWWDGTQWVPGGSVNPFPTTATFSPSGIQDVNIKQANGTTQSTGAGAVGTGSQRVAVGQDTTTIAGSAPGTAGTPSANVVSVQGEASMTPILETPTPATSGGVSTSSVIVPNNTTSVALKASAGQLIDLDGFSISAATPIWIKFYDAAQGSTTCGSGTPKLRYMVGGQGTTGTGTEKEFHFGVPFATAITYCITAGIADNDTTAPAASTYVVNFGYK